MKNAWLKLSENLFKDGNEGRITNFLIIFAFIFCAFIAFRTLQSNDSEQLVSAISSILRNESMAANPYQLSKSIADIETLGLVDCVTLQEARSHGSIFYDTSSASRCHMNTWLGKFRTTRDEITSINGAHFIVNIQPKLDLAKIILEIIVYIIIIVTFVQIRRNIVRNTKLTEARIQAIELEKQMVVDHTRQIRHDVASPLTAINTIIRLIPQIDPELKSVLALAMDRTQNLFNDLNRAATLPLESVPTKNTLSKIEALRVVEAVLAEKKSVWQNSVETIFVNSIQEPTYALCDKSSLERILSNLLNNAFEACDTTKEPKVLIETNCTPSTISIEISDNGKGIPAKDLPRIGEKGVSIGKENHATAGSGLGIYSTIQTLKEWDAKFKISSIEDGGTTVTILLKRG